MLLKKQQLFQPINCMPITLDVETADKKFGIAQKIEQKNCVDLIGQEVTLSFKAKVSATTNLDNVKCAIIFHGTELLILLQMILFLLGVQRELTQHLLQITHMKTLQLI